MPTSTVITYAEQSANWIWDSVVGILYTNKAGLFIIMIALVISTISLVIVLIKQPFSKN